MTGKPFPRAERAFQDPRRGGIRRISLWILAVAVVLAFLPSLLIVRVWIGHFPLTIDAHSESGKAIDELSIAAFQQLDVASWAVTYSGRDLESDFRSTERKGGRFIAHITCTGSSWIFNVETDYNEPQFLVLQVVYGDGEKHRCLVETPPGRGPRSLTVTVP